jgi:ribosomal protein S18 acetylase RimI-like enzyme
VPLLSVHKITRNKADLFKAVRLRALQDAPHAFASTYEQESKFSDAEWHARIERWNGERGIGFLAMDSGEPCGLAGSLLDEADATRAQLVSVWTAPTYRRQGVGCVLVNAVIAWARSRKARVLRLMVTQTNEPAIRFYERLGFAMTGRTEPYPNDPALAECEMSLSID